MLTLNKHSQKVTKFIDFTSKSTCYSPFSLMHALSILVKCSNDESIKELVSKLEFNEQEMHEFSNMLKQDSSVALASNIFDTQLEKIANDFKALMMKTFEIVPEKLVSATQVNDWCAKHTNNKIKEIIDSIDGITTILISAIHFKAAWAFKFDPKMTVQKTFNGFKGASTVQMMHMKKKVHYGENDTVQMARLRYSNSGLQALIILPRESTPAAFNAALCVENLQENLFEEMTTFEMPRFKIESTFNLNDTLKQLGVSKIFDSVNCIETLGDVMKVQDVVQKTFMETNEEGTEAAAVTGIMMMRCAMMPEEPREMICDRPFWFLLVNQMGGIVFATSVVE
ncbi:Serpin_1 [Hexamita inflata]|uniref:Serpin 1 n=2 Tax=Hexamita inflata TaxID=28002 RepID=A0AA86NVV6_9EUKA|nr:Serpin 1 [Hexamita inflata]CAI9926598.1 Serpin 1 [Hexamita inflata]